MRMLTLALVLLCGGVARGEKLVTDAGGPGDLNGGSLALGRPPATSRELAVDFKIDQPYVIESIEMVFENPGADVESRLESFIYKNSEAGMPGEEVFSYEYSLRYSDTILHQVPVESLTLPPGEYWVAIASLDDTTPSLAYGDVDILGVTWAAQKYDNDETWSRKTMESMRPVMQVHAHAVPEPAGPLLMPLAMMAVAIKRKATRVA